MLLKQILIFICILAFSMNVMAQTTGTLKGVVLDENGETVPFAILILVKDDLQVISTYTDYDGNFIFINLPVGAYNLEVSYIGYATVKKEGLIVDAGQETIANVELKQGIELDCVVVECYSVLHAQCNASGGRSLNSIALHKKSRKFKKAKIRSSKKIVRGNVKTIKKEDKVQSPPGENPSQEEYISLIENEFQTTQDEPYSTFSIDVDRASYSNIRRHLTDGKMPPKDAVRIEEMVNYFDYNYPQPQGEHPFGVSTELSDCPWNKDAKLLHIALQGKHMDMDTAAPTNLVFLIDVSGSMEAENKLPLVKSSLELLIKKMRTRDQMAIVVYAGAAGVVQRSTNDKNLLIDALNRLQSGGSTAGGEGIELAYKIAKENFVKDGNNRVILATDGDFNVGVSSEQELENLIVEKRKDHIFLTVLGFGMGNYKDSKMEILADKGNGNYAYIDNIKEAEKMLVKEMGSTLYTIAKDVKLQLVFNSKLVKSYRLVGYENRMLEKKDFRNDKKDAGDMGAGHTVTALYEIILEQNPTVTHSKEIKNDELVLVKLRYKEPKGKKSTLVEIPFQKTYLPLAESSENFRFSAAVAGFGMLLRGSKFSKELTYEMVWDLANESMEFDERGYRAEFLELVENVETMMSTTQK